MIAVPSTAVSAAMRRLLQIALPAAAIHLVEVVVLERRRQIVRPEAWRARRRKPPPIMTRTISGDQRADDKEQSVSIAGIGLGLVTAPRGPTAAADCLRWTHGPRRRQSTAGTAAGQADHRAHPEVLLADDLLVDVGGEHVVLAADHLWHTEVRDDQREHDEGRADQAVTRARHGDGPESAPGAGLERLGRLVETRVGDCQRRGHDDERVREGPEHLADDDADRPIDRGAEQSSLGDPLIAEQVDEADGRQQRGRQQRDLRRPA